MLEPLWESQGALLQAHFCSRHFGLLQHHLLHENHLTSSEDGLLEVRWHVANPQGHRLYVLQALPSYLAQYLLGEARWR